ncbi:MAG: glutamine synthetase [Ignavibacteria bacterium]|nr:glutamine synthetase [Ignavibacteria bacterium]
MNFNYALANPVSVLADKPREQFTREDFIRIIELKNIEHITFHYTALDGKLKELKIPVCNRMQAERILAEGERVDGSSLFKGMVDISLSDLYVVPVYKTAFFSPFDDRSLDFICRYFLRDGTFAPFALDTILRRAADLFRKKTSADLYALGELEFFLLSETTARTFIGQKQRGYHGSAPFIKSGEIVNEMARYITQITGAVKYTHSEVGYIENISGDENEIDGKRGEQFEIEFLPMPIEDAADNVVLARWLVRNVAHKNNCVATFTPKLEEGIAGNGMHFHIAVMRDGKNRMLDDNGTLSLEAKKVIGGLCTYADSLTAFGNTVSSAYLRLVPNQEAPTKICWSDLNRSAMIRVPLGWSNVSNLAMKLNPQQTTEFHDTIGRQTVELRSPDGSAIVHLLLAGITLAAEWGLTNDDALRIANEMYVTGNIFHDKELLNKLFSLPKSCVESSRILLAKRNLYERENIFPRSVTEYVAKLLQAENDEEMNNYLIDLPADDRLHETRKIMHKDLHRH